MANDIIAQVGQSVGSGKIVNENGYRYEGSNPNNWVCFGSDATPCPADNLYRIIGTFNEYNNSSGSMQQSYVVKLIKADKYNNTTYIWYNTCAWNTSNYQYSSYSSSQMKDTMNNNYYNSLNNTSKNMIALSRWWTGTYNSQSDWYNYNAQSIYDNERRNYSWIGPKSGDFYIGVMYASDYMYSALASDCSRSTTSHSYSSCKSVNWMKQSYQQWTISRPFYWSSGNLYTQMFFINTDGNVLGGTNSCLNSSFYVHPVFYLKNNVKILSGNGTSNNPYRIKL